MLSHLVLDGREGPLGSTEVRAALTLSAATGRPLELRRPREGTARAGLTAAEVTLVRALGLACAARATGAFERSPEMRFEPGAVTAGEFRIELGAPEPVSWLVQALAPVLSRAGEASRVVVTGGSTHSATAPSHEYLGRHWVALAARLGLRLRLGLRRAGFTRGGGEVDVEVAPAEPVEASLLLEERGPLVALRGVSGSARRPAVADRQLRAATERLWEARRLEVEWAVLRVPADSAGTFLCLEAVFENGRAAFTFLSEPRTTPEAVGDRAARTLLRFLDGGGVVDPPLAGQLAVPLALAGVGGRVQTPEVTADLVAVVGVLVAFGYPASIEGALGGAGVFEVKPS